MDSGSNNTIMVAALGRPFTLGKLYDCRQDSLIPSLTLWGREDLVNHVIAKPQSYNDFQIFKSESLSQKTSAFSLSVSLKASFLFGLVSISGSAKYLHNSKKSRRQARVTLKYEGTTEFKELSMEHLGRQNVKYPEVFERGIGTHVVTGILYGAQAFFVFDCDVSEEESHDEFENNFSGILRSLSNKIINGTGLLNMEPDEVKIVERFSCKLQGDFYLRKTPTCFQEAMEVYEKLPKLLQENAVPLKVWLAPLTNFDSSANRVVREISAAVVGEVQDAVELLHDLEVRCNDALRSTAHFPQISEKLLDFKKTCFKYQLDIQHTLARKLPSVRSGAEENNLEKVCENRVSSPLSSTNLSSWLDGKEREIDTLTFFCSMMKNVQIVSSKPLLYKEVLSVEHAVCFVFTSLGRDEQYLSALSKFLMRKPNANLRAPEVGREKWYASKEVLDEMRRKVKVFSEFAEANKENKSIKFLTVGLTDDKHKGSTIHLYKDGFPVSENFEPPSQPETVTAADVTRNSVTLKVSSPRFGAENITSYSVEVRVHGEDGWKQSTESKAGEVTVRELKPNTEHVFRCRALTSAGVGPANEITIKTLV